MTGAYKELEGERSMYASPMHRTAEPPVATGTRCADGLCRRPRQHTREL